MYCKSNNQCTLIIRLPGIGLCFLSLLESGYLERKVSHQTTLMTCHGAMGSKSGLVSQLHLPAHVKESCIKVSIRS